ncbi:CotD family spore coat protein [Thalassobacillus hwangdonensis]|uniref:CotD family spore coat protein n=1 Tax=Thalassobacillus hwangdonensis TaxID=546108 RepID=A0ABW3L1G0_9BACI
MFNKHMNCGCPQVSPAQQVVHPTKHCVKHNFYKQDVNHIYPTHTTVMNHHLTENKHFFPQTQSVENTFNQTNTFMPPQQVSPAMQGPRPPMGPGGPGGQVAGAQTGMGPGSQVAGAQTGMGPMGSNMPPMGAQGMMPGMGRKRPWR